MNATSLRRCLAGACLLALAAGSRADDNPKRPPLSLAVVQQFTDAIERIRADAVTPVDDEAMLAAATKGALAKVDPEGKYYTAAEARSESSDLRRGAANVGLEVRVRQGFLLLFPRPDGPAALAGVRAGDALRTIDGLPVAGLRPDEVAPLLRGETGSHVVLGLARADSSALQKLDVERRVMIDPRPSVTRIDAGVAVLHLAGFDERALPDAVAALSREWAKQRFKGLVLDLRHSPGGLLDVSVGLAALFLEPNAVVMSTTGRIADANQTFRASPADYLRRGGPDPVASLPAAVRAVPLVVLVDGGTASGAEIVAAALHDHGRAAVVGHATFGRGIIQTVMPLPGGAVLKLTTATFATPSGAQLQGKGLVPDVLVDSDDEEQALQAAVATLRKRL